MNDQVREAERTLNQAKAAQITAEKEVRRVTAKYSAASEADRTLAVKQEMNNASKRLARTVSDVSVAEKGYQKLVQIKRRK